MTAFNVVIVRVGNFILDAEWRQAQDRALATLEIPGIIVVLGPADVGRFFLRDLVVGLRKRGRAVTFVPRADLLEPAQVANSTLVIEDAARMDAAMLEAICRAPGRRVVLVGLSALALPELPAPLTVVSLEPFSPGTAAAPRSSSRSNARVAIASGVLAATCVAGALVWTRAPWAPAPSRVAVLQPAVELPPAPGSPSAPPEPAPSASEQPGDATSAALPLPAGDEDRPSRQAVNVPPAASDVNQLPSPLPLVAEAPRAIPPEPAAPGRVTALQPTIGLPPASGSPSAPWAPPEKPSPKLVQGIACPPRDTFENAQTWVHERLKCERHPTPNGLWIEWAEYCPSGPLGYFVLKVKTGQQKVYLFENIPPAVWEGFKAAPSADKFYHSEIKGKRHWFRLASKLKPSAPELTCR
jgi:hypothetical protein